MMAALSPDVRIAANPEMLMRNAAELFVTVTNEAVRTTGLATVALSGGSTPRGLYILLATDPVFRGLVPWTQIHFFWGDERHVPPDHPDSNYRMAHETMLSPVGVPADHIHRIKAELPDPASAADAYERTLQEFGRSGDRLESVFDLVLLGMGTDGHTASLFPGTDALHERSRLALASWVEKLKAHRITLTVAALSSAAHVVFLVSGADKAASLGAVLQCETPTELFPASLIRPSTGRLTWMVDQEAARLLPDAIRLPGSDP
jgi:6-phosphogluconolactonase